MSDRLSAPAFIFMNARVSAIIEISADRFRNAPVAQLDRASGYEPEGREFESLRAHHLSQGRNPPALGPQSHRLGLHSQIRPI